MVKWFNSGAKKLGWLGLTRTRNIGSGARDCRRLIKLHYHEAVGILRSTKLQVKSKAHIRLVGKFRKLLCNRFCSFFAESILSLFLCDVYRVEHRSYNKT